MKKNFFMLMVFCLPFLLLAQTETDIDGFRGLKWDTPKSEFQFELVKSKNKTPGYQGFDRVDEDLTFEGVKAHVITYVFDGETFVGINIGIEKQDLESVLNAFKIKYGEPIVKDTPFLINYEYYLEKTMISITFFPMMEGTKTVSIGMGKLQKIHERGKNDKSVKLRF